MSDLTNVACDGYRGEQNTHAYSSPNWCAHELGAFFRKCGKPAPSKIKMSRGYSIRAENTVYRIEGYKTAEFIQQN